ncbi:DUF4197 domain-containing protein [Flaviaesturariibacter aridisoli]|uniref:DUF4197 domain-containing protein n=1 Tax=Flaviaesturariibacter aridisoli TaxID=2545761 RepID=A0A4R4E4V0_9BACT|nr:DUF4197 domain-containing protein [Flaviaesturariibacter aridisoli]TCZ72273.1 DUF4197 domain-containing protein [Flaviaesturariibacter aridisoli]
MKKLLLPIFALLIFPLLNSCSGSKLLNYTLTEQDAAAAIRELLNAGARNGSVGNAFSKENVVNTVFPSDVAKVFNTLNNLGLSKDLDRFTTSLSGAATASVERAVPVFASAISGMRLGDAINLVKGGGTSATDYLKANTGANLRTALTPVMENALAEYKLNDQWNKLIGPIKNTGIGSRLNLDLSNLMAAAVSEAMFRKMAEGEQLIRTNASYRTTPLLQKVFGRSW